MAPMGVGMVARGRMGFVPHRIRDVDGLRAILARAAEIEAAGRDPEVHDMTSYLFYPGCSLAGSARAYAESLDDDPRPARDPASRRSTTGTAAERAST